MNAETTMDGGCLCGTVRYRVAGSPFAAEHCHCRMCQKGSGAAVVSWMDVREDQVTWTSGTPKEYRSSEHCWRGFCPRCGSTLSFRDTRHPDYFTLTITSLDDPDLVTPACHIYVESQVDWLTMDDNCKRFPGSSGGQ